MGFFYRKSVNFGPFRVNLSKSGVGYSVGGKGFRVGTSARGRRYSAFSIPGTGVGYRGSGCLVLLAALPLAHDFQQVETLPENDRTRYTITPQARKDLLTRLLKFNHQRAAEEAAAQAAKSPTTTGIKARKPQRVKQEDELL